MISIIVDTREQKTPSLIDIYKREHPKIVANLEFIYSKLDTGDLFGNNQLVEIKWGADLHSSINSDRLESELIKMKTFLTKPANRNCIGHLYMCDFKNFKMTLDLFKRATNLGQKYGVWIHHRASILQGMDALIDIIRNPPPPIELNLPVSRSKKDPFLLDCFSRIPSVSMDCAEAVIPTGWHTLKDLFKFNEAEYQSAVNAFYERDMRAICQNIVKKLGL